MKRSKGIEMRIIFGMCIFSLAIILSFYGIRVLHDFQKTIILNKSLASQTSIQDTSLRNNTLGSSSLNSMRQSKKPNPSTLIPTLISITDSSIRNHYPTWMDENGAIYGYVPGTPSTIVKSMDYWESWKDLFTIDTVKYGDVQNVIVAGTNRVIVSCEGGAILTTDSNQANPKLSFVFDGGYGSRLFGHSVYQNIVLLSSYGFKADGNYGNGPRQVYLSSDGGSTFSNILNRIAPNPEIQAHIHDVEFDPYSNRIWVAFGDNQNRQLMVSDDLGKTWNSIYPVPIDQSVPQFTQIISFPDGVVFGTDSVPEGFWYWKRQSSMVQAKDIQLLQSFEDTGNMLGQFASRRWNARAQNTQVCLVPFVRNPNVLSFNGSPRLFASPDGLAWYELYRGPKKEGTNNYYGLLNIIGPSPSDPQRRIFGIWQDDKIYSLFKATLPEFN